MTPTRVRVRLFAWGITGADIERAVNDAGWRQSRQDWDFVEIQRLDGPSCPLNLCDPATIAADEGNHWAYAVYPAGAAS